MSLTGSTSVIPYGVCNSAFGASTATARSVSDGTGAPAENTTRSAARPVWSPGAPVATTFANAAGEANARVAPIRSHAASSAAAVNSPGLVTSHAGSAVGIPSAGP